MAKRIVFKFKAGRMSF